MTNWYDNDEEFTAKGIDYDLCACLDYNPQNTFVVEDIKKVWAVWEGENDGDDWRWVLELDSGQFVFLQGGCDYTGWDCQSWATHAFADTPEQAAEKAMGDVSTENSSPADAGLGHLLSMLGGTYADNFSEVRDSLLKQVQEGKQKTWTEQKEEEFKVLLSPPQEFGILAFVRENLKDVENILDAMSFTNPMRGITEGRKIALQSILDKFSMDKEN